MPTDSIHNKIRRNEARFDGDGSEKLEVFEYPIECLGKEGSRYLTDKERKLAEEYVFLNSPEIYYNLLIIYYNLFQAVYRSCYESTSGDNTSTIRLLHKDPI